jgi:hypothetical protein
MSDITSKTPQSQQRLSIILILSAFLIWLGTALHWNLTQHGFIYREAEAQIEKIPKPTEEANNAFWREETTGWGLYDGTCVDTDRTSKPETDPLTYVPPLACRTKVVPHKQIVSYKWHQSFARYLGHSFKHWGNYFWYSMLAVLLLGSGVLLYSGLVNRLTSTSKSANH